MSREIDPQIALGINTEVFVGSISGGLARTAFSYKDRYYSGDPRMGPYKAGRRQVVWSGGRVYVVTSLAEGSGFTVTTGDGRRKRHFGSGERMKIGDKTFEGE